MMVYLQGHHLRSVGAKNPHLYILLLRDVKSERGEGRVKPPKSLNIGVFNVRGCSTNELKKGEIGKMFLKLRFDVCALSETKLKGKGEVIFGELVGRVSGVAREGVALLLSEWLMRCVVEWKEVSSRLMWVREQIERQLGVYIAIWTG